MTDSQRGQNESPETGQSDIKIERLTLDSYRLHLLRKPEMGRKLSVDLKEIDCCIINSGGC